MIESIKNYISECPYLDEFTTVNVNYLVDKTIAYSVNEEALIPLRSSPATVSPHITS